MSDVFVSYKAEDRRRIRPLVDALQADGLSVWWDQDIGTGDAWREEIERQLDAARCVIVVWSKRAVGPEGRFVRDEATRAQRRGVYVPVLIDAVEPPLGFGECQATSLRGWNGSGTDPRYLAVLATVQRIAGAGSGDNQPVIRAQPAFSRRAALAGTGIAAVAVAGAGGWMLFKPSSSAASDSIAVLPFANLSGDASQAYFSDGIAEELRNTLARLPGVQVVGRTSSEAVRDTDARTAAEKLGAGNVLTGSVRQSPSMIRVSAQLVDGRTGLEKWSNSYDRPPGDSIRIQADIAANVASVLSAALGKAARAAGAIGGTSNPEAQKLLLQAADASRSGSEADLARALQLIDRAIQLDPKYADAYARKARYLTLQTDYFGRDTNEFAHGRSEALQMARTAIRLAPKLPSGHLSLGAIYLSSFQLGPALAEFKRALELGPSEATALRSYSVYLGQLGQFSRALGLADKAVASDPLDPASYALKIRILYYARRYNDALAYAQTLPAHFVDQQQLLARCLMMAGRLDDARREYARAPQDLLRQTYEAVLAARSGDREAAIATAKAIETQQGPTASYQIAQIYAQAGQTERALAALEQGWTIRDPGLLITGVDPILDPIREEPRFKSLVREMNFPA